LDAYIWK
jgi:hypothetical protein